MKQQNFSLLIVVIASVLLSCLHCPLFEIFFDDKEIFKYTGLVISKGGVPYRDFFDHKPPLIFFLNYTGFIMGSWGLWVIDGLLILATSLFFLHRCNRYKIYFPWLLPVLFNLLIRNHAVSYGIGMTREYTSVFLLLFFCVMLAENEKKFILLGVLAALIFFMQQDQVLIVIPFMLYSLLTQLRQRRLIKHMLLFVGGFALITSLILGYFSYNNSLSYFWQDAFLFNFQWYNKSYPIAENLKAIRNMLHDTAYEMSFYMTLVTGIFGLLYNSKRRALLLACLITLAASFSAALISGKIVDGLAVYYYFLPLSASIPILLFVLFSCDEGLKLANKKPQLIFGAMLFVIPFLSILQYGTNLSNGKEAYYKPSVEYQYLKDKQLKDFDLYIAFNANFDFLYNEFKILSPSKWVYHFFWVWFDKWDADRSIFRSIINDLQLHKTKYIFDGSDDDFLFKDPDIYNEWKLFLNTYYEKIELGRLDKDRKVLWKRKD